MKLALANWNGRISPVFDVARQVVLLEIERGLVTVRREEPLPGTDPQAQAQRLVELGAQTLICGAISQPMAAILAARGIKIVPFTAGAVDEVLTAWLSGNLPNPALSMPGCCGRTRRRHGCGARGACRMGGF